MRTATVARGARSALALAFVATAALAQDGEPPDSQEPLDTIPVETAPAQPEPEGTTRLETIQITGSRLKRTDTETAQPVFTISREDIERSGLTDITEIMRGITAAGNNSLSPQQGRFALTMGEANLDLRNLGSNHTLLLVNGRRWVTGLIQTQTSVSDYNTIPTAIIERVEVLKDGASAIYGSDAIGGVVNVITRRDYTGRELSYHFGQYFQQGDGLNRQLSVTWGDNFQDTNFVLNLSYTDQDEVPNENRPVSAVPNAGPTRNSIVSRNGAFLFVDLDSSRAGLYQCPNLQAGIAAGAAPPDAQGPVSMTSVIPAGIVLCSLTLNQGAEGGQGNPNDYHQIDNTNPLDTWNRFADGTLKEPNERSALYAQLDHKLFDWITLSFEGLYNKRQSDSVGQNAYLGGGNLDGGPRGHLAYIAAGNAFNGPAHDIGYDSSCGGTGDAPLDVTAYETSTSCTGIGDGTGVWAIRRRPGLNNQVFRDEVDTVRAGTGASGDFDLLGQYVSWEGGWVYSRSKIEELLASVNYEKAGQALGSFGATCEAPCVPLNVFQGPDGLDPAAVDFILDTTWQRNRTQQDIIYLNAASDVPYTGDFLPAPVAAAFGGEFRREQYKSAIDPRISNGLIRLNSLNGLDGATYAREAFVELGIPLVRDFVVAEALDLDLAGRYSHYPRIGGITTGKAGLRWQVFEDLLLRSTYSTGFRAPNIGELFLGASQSFDPLSDPCANPGENQNADDNCAADGTSGGGDGGAVATPYDIWSGNLDLQPEKSVNLTYGAIYSPSWLPDFNVSVDFYDIEIDDFVVIGQGQFFLDSCYKVPADQRNYCNFINRNDLGTLLFVETPYFNLTRVETAGVDIAFDYLLPLPEEAGRFKIAVDTSYLMQYDNIAPQPGGPDQVTSSVGQAFGQFQGFPEWKGGAYLTWSRDVMKASWSTRMAYKMVEPCGDLFPTPSLKDLGLCSHPDIVDSDGNPAPENHLKTLYYHNVQFGYSFPNFYNGDITLGINNVLDQDPNISRSLTSLYWYNYDPNHYEVPGRLGYVRVKFSF